MATLGSSSGFSAGSPEQPRPKRARVNLACQRCKTRKQKCDGAQPACSPCLSHGAQCRYVTSTVPSKPAERKQYIKALEDRILELESRLVSVGHADVVNEKWRPELNGDGDSIVSAVRDLSIDASGFVGASSTITLGRMLGDVIGSKQQLDLSMSPDQKWEVGPRSVATETVYSSPGDTVTFFVTPKVADRLFAAYLAYFATNYPVANSVFIRDLHTRRDFLTDPYEISVLRLVYSAAGRILETTGESGNYFCSQNYDTALENREEILAFGDTRSLVYLLLLAFNCIRAPREPGAWSYLGLATRLCIEIGLHRRTKVRQATLKAEIEKRLFWSCYFLDREVSIALGRPSAVSDRDIDVQLPLEIDEDEEDIEVIKNATTQDQSVPADPPSDMSCFIHMLRLKRIESDVQQTIYRVDITLSRADVHKATDAFLDRFLAWRDVIPKVARKWKDEGLPPTHSLDAYMVSYYKGMRTLLGPLLYEQNPPKRFVDYCAEACIGVCATYRRLHHDMPVAFSTLSLQTIFLAGLTLVYSLWLLPDPKFAMKITMGLHDASILLYVIAERWPGYTRYRDAFEAIKTAVMAKIAEGEHKPREKVTHLDAEARAKLQQFDCRTAEDSVVHMLGDMTGEQFDVCKDAEFAAVEKQFGSGFEGFGVLGSQGGFEGFPVVGMDFNFADMACVDTSQGWIGANVQDFEPNGQLNWSGHVNL